jgi:hypothetical protein
MVPAITPPHRDPSSQAELAAMLSELFDRSVLGYLWCLDHEHWSALLEYGQIIDCIHALAEQVAA